MIPRSLRFVVIFAGIGLIAFGQWQVDIGARIQRTPLGRATSIRYGRTASSFTPQIRILPSEGRYLASAQGLLPSESRGLRMASGPLPSSGAYSHLIPRSVTVRPYNPVYISNPGRPKNYGRSYVGIYDRKKAPPLPPLGRVRRASSVPRAEKPKYRPVTGSIR